VNSDVIGDSVSFHGFLTMAEARCSRRRLKFGGLRSRVAAGSETLAERIAEARCSRRRPKFGDLRSRVAAGSETLAERKGWARPTQGDSILDT
jgi:hypothetical protein